MDSTNEPTGIIGLTKREAPSHSQQALNEYISNLDDVDKKVLQEIQSIGGLNAMLVINRGKGIGSRFLVTADGVTIGRSTSCSILLDDVTVSRSHAEVVKSDLGFTLRDCHSLNGTYLNNESVEQAVLTSGDQIQVGKFHLLFVCSLKVVETK